MRVPLLAAVFALFLPVSAFANWFVSTERQTYRPGEPIVVHYEGFYNPKDWMVVVPAGAPDSTWKNHDWTYRDDRPADGIIRFRGLPPGLYEVRGYCCWDGRDFTVQSRAVFEVTDGRMQPSDDRRAKRRDEPRVPPRASVDGKYSGLLATFTCETDRRSYGDFTDYGSWNGGPWCGEDRPAGFWVWVAPKWYIWERQN